MFENRHFFPAAASYLEMRELTVSRERITAEPTRRPCQSSWNNLRRSVSLRGGNMTPVNEVVPPLTLPIPSDADICADEPGPGWTKDDGSDPPVPPDGGPDGELNGGGAAAVTTAVAAGMTAAAEVSATRVGAGR